MSITRLVHKIMKPVLPVSRCIPRTEMHCSRLTERRCRSEHGDREARLEGPQSQLRAERYCKRDTGPGWGGVLCGMSRQIVRIAQKTKARETSDQFSVVSFRQAESDR